MNMYKLVEPFMKIISKSDKMFIPPTGPCSLDELDLLAKSKVTTQIRSQKPTGERMSSTISQFIPDRITARSGE